MTTSEPRIYIQDASFVMPRTFLTEEEYGRALESLVVVCADVLVVNKERNVLLLASRKAKPIQGPWMFGGRLYAGERETDAASRILERETSLHIEKSRLQYIGMHRYVCSERQQIPQDKGSDTLAFNFYLELSNEEIQQAASSLDSDEYDKEAGLKEFDMKALESEHVHPALLDLHNQIFH